MKPRLDAAGIKLLLVSIGTPERGKDCEKENGFPEANLYADPKTAPTTPGLQPRRGANFLRPEHAAVHEVSRGRTRGETRPAPAATPFLNESKRAGAGS